MVKYVYAQNPKGFVGTVPYMGLGLVVQYWFTQYILAPGLTAHTAPLSRPSAEKKKCVSSDLRLKHIKIPNTEMGWGYTDTATREAFYHDGRVNACARRKRHLAEYIHHQHTT